jgi:8-oxo-dGTP pyrophosphatase MutT (NUDIX family)
MTDTEKIDHQNPPTVVVGLIPTTYPGELTLAGIIRGKKGDAGYGKIALPGGWVNKGESLEAAIVREVWEEIRFQSIPMHWRLMYSDHIEAANINLVFCLYKYTLSDNPLANFSVNEEVSEVTFIDVSHPLAFPKHERAVKKFYDGSWLK